MFFCYCCCCLLLLLNIQTDDDADDDDDDDDDDDQSSSVGLCMYIGLHKYIGPYTLSGYDLCQLGYL